MKSICLVGNYPPRCCGIATFTQDLRAGLLEAAPDLKISVAAVTEESPACYPSEVKWFLDQHRLDTYLRAAEQINREGVDSVCVQHEFGIFGGPDGAHIGEFLKRIEAPVVTTCHTVLAQPTLTQTLALRAITQYSKRLVVMSEKGRGLLSSSGVPNSRIDVIPHGIPEANIGAKECSAVCGAVGWVGRRVLLTFGLISPNKGLEQAIRAMPEIIKAIPTALYAIVGTTHPNLFRHEGEKYRESLERLVAELGLENHVQFLNRFVGRQELLQLIAASAVYLTPYLNEAQITSGTLAYAFGLGKPVISTPYWHAAELLANDGGILVPFNNASAIANAAADLLLSPQRLSAMGERARERGKSMVWTQVARRYLELFAETAPAWKLQAVPSRVALSSNRIPAKGTRWRWYGT